MPPTQSRADEVADITRAARRACHANQQHIAFVLERAMDCFDRSQGDLKALKALWARRDKWASLPLTPHQPTGIPDTTE